MSNAYKALVIAVIVIFVGAVWYTSTPGDEGGEGISTEPVGSYAYTCDKGLEFLLLPTPDMSSVTIRPIVNMAYPPVSVLADSPTDTGRRFRGADFELHGQGESVTLYVTASDTTYTCAPQPKPDEAPLNFGD